MNVLFLAPRLPWPADTGGKIRTWNILKQAASRHTVDLVTFFFDPKETEELRAFENIGVSVTLVPHRDAGSLQKFRTAAFSPLPVSIVKYDKPAMQRAVDRLLDSRDYDVIHCDHIHMAAYHRPDKIAMSYVDEHNVEYKILERCAGVEPWGLKKFAYAQQAAKMRAYESRQVNRFKACGVVSEQDGDLIAGITGGRSRIHVVPNGVDTGYFCPPPADNAPEDAVVFTGSMDWLPNDDAVMFFARDIFPRVLEKRPECKLYVVGKGASAGLRKLAAENPRIIVTGRVDDVREYVYRSKVFIVPLRIGGGTRLKILEAMSMQMPVISTAIGAEGIRHTDGENIVLADDPADFAGQIVMLLGDEARRRALGAEGRKLVLAEYDWPIIGRKLFNIYEGRHGKDK